MYANWRYPAGAEGTDPSSPRTRAPIPPDRLNATDAIGYAVRFQVKGVRQDPPMFQALVSLLQDKDEPVRSTAAGILAPAYESAGEGRSGAALPKAAGKNGWTRSPPSTLPTPDCDRRSVVGLPTDAEGRRSRRDTRRSAAAAMMYANGKGVQQNYAEAGKWWIKAAEGGDLAAARFAWQNRSTQGVQRNPEVVAQLAKDARRAVPVPRCAAAPAGTPAPARQQ